MSRRVSRVSLSCVAALISPAYDQGPNLLKQPIQEGSKNIEDASSKTKIITWEEHKKNRVPSFKYEKDKAFQRKPPPPKSGLAAQLGDLPRPKKQHEVTVWIEGAKEGVKCPVRDGLLVAGVIEFALRQFDSQGKVRNAPSPLCLH